MGTGAVPLPSPPSGGVIMVLHGKLQGTRTRVGTLPAAWLGGCFEFRDSSEGDGVLEGFIKIRPCLF